MASEAGEDPCEAGTTRVSEAALGILSLALAAAGGWMLVRSFREGKSVTNWPLSDATRADNPWLFWFDVGTYAAVIIMGAIASVQLLRS